MVKISPTSKYHSPPRPTVNLLLLALLMASTLALSAQETTSDSGAEPTPAVGRHTFTLGTNDFLLDSKPFQIRSGEMHPARIPHQYWRHRMRMAKAMGLNAVAAYLFWSSYEVAADQYDFTTNERNIGEFLQTAKEEGLWVLLRAGPYCCGEWDLGGIPVRLLKTPGIKLRCSDPNYIGPVERYLHQLAPVVRPYLAENGGPILMVQLENEYGSYPRRDHNYMVWLRDQWVKEGVKGPFFTGDGPGTNYLKGVVIPGVAIGLDSGLREKHWEIARSMNPGVPVFSSETYPGWLRHWGEGYWKPDDLREPLKFYMTTGKSFNLYMFHGGTCFGFTAGANAGGKGYEPDVTSYDYASPVNEQGRPTPAYYNYRDLLASYLPPGQKPPEPPAAIPAMKVPDIKLSRWSSVWEQLPKPLSMPQPLCFEALDQNQGLMVYRTRIPAGDKRPLTFANLHDYGQVFVDGALIGTLDRRLGQHELELPPCAKEATLEILVEAMGHINFAIQMESDRKGIYGDVKLAGQVLKDWEQLPLPLQTQWAMTMKRTTPGSERPGGIFKGEFTLETVTDTYLDLSQWKKGVVWVNGHNLGRYWDIGPQQRLYCPGPWLNKGRNTIVVLDQHLTQPQALRGMETPRDEPPAPVGGTSNAK